MVKSEPKQFCRNILLSMERYSPDTTNRMVDLLTSHERVIQIEQLIDRELPEQEFLAELNKLEE